MVMNTEHVGSSLISVSSKMKWLTPSRMASQIDMICCATTDSTSMSMRLNSSKHAHAPELARPLKNLPIAK